MSLKHMARKNVWPAANQLKRNIYQLKVFLGNEDKQICSTFKSH